MMMKICFGREEVYIQGIIILDLRLRKALSEQVVPKKGKGHPEKASQDGEYAGKGI